MSRSARSDAQVRKELRVWLRRLHDEVHVTTVFVTHDQEEALEVSDLLVVIDHGRIEQVGTPDQLYDQPANEFVMGFLGPVTQLGDVLIRPHDIDVLSHPSPGAIEARVERLQRVGFEVRVEMVTSSGRPSVQMTRGQADAIQMAGGDRVWLRPAPSASTLTSGPATARASEPSRLDEPASWSPA